MKEGFGSRNALVIYGFVVAFVFVAFLLGLLIGNRESSRQVVQPVVPSYEPEEDLETKLQFYEELSKPSDTGEVTMPAAVTPVQPKPDPPAAPKSDDIRKPTVEMKPSGTGSYTIQVAALSTETEAQQLLFRLSAKEFEGRIRSPVSDSNDKYYRVWVGEFSSVDEARRLEEELKEKGFQTFIRRID